MAKHTDWSHLEIICSVCKIDIMDMMIGGNLHTMHSSEPYIKNGVACYPCFIETIVPIRLTIWDEMQHTRSN